jgi:membrane fusion protein, heavy metal efflux system
MILAKRHTLITLTVGAFVAGVAATWFVLRGGHSNSAIAATVSAPSTLATPVSGPLDDNRPLDIVSLSDASRSGRIQTEALKITAVPQSGALPGKIVLDENRTARLSAPVTGRVLKLFKEPGDRVGVGDVLATIDTPELAGVQAEASKAQVELGLKSSAAQRMQELYSVGAVALKELQAAQAEAKEAQTELDRTHNRLRQLNSLGRISSTYHLLSPIAGSITERAVTVGQQVRAEEALNLFVISDLKHLNMIVDAPEAQVAQFAVGQAIQVSLDDKGSAVNPEGKQNSSSIEAVISRIGPSVDPLTRRVQVRANVNNELGALRPEMFVRAFSIDARQKKALELPVSSLAARGSESAVFIEREPGKYQRIPVAILAQHPERAWVEPLAGKAVASGAKVVTQGALLLDSEIASR